MDTENTLYVVGAGGHAKVVLHVLESKQIKAAGILDTDPVKIGTSILNYPITHIEDKALPHRARFIIAIGDNAVRAKLFTAMQIRGWHAFNVIDNSTRIANTVKLGKGTVVFPFGSIHPDTQIGSNVIINTHTVIEHDNYISDHAHIGPNATLCGGVVVEEGAFVGAGVTIIPGIKIGAWSVIGAGAVVTKNIPETTVVVGCPARAM